MLRKTSALICTLGLFAPVPQANAELLLVGLHSPHLTHAEANSYHFVENSPLLLRASTYDKLNAFSYVEFYAKNPWGQYQKIGDDHSRAANASYYETTLPTVQQGDLTLMVKGVTHDGRVIHSEPVTIEIKSASDLVVTHADLSQPMKEFRGITSIPKEQIASISTIWDGFITSRAYESNNIWFGINPTPTSYVQTNTISHQVITKSGNIYYSKPQKLVTLAQNCADDWQNNQTYWANDYVYYQGMVYQSSYWSHNQTPSQTDQWGPWEFVAECE